MAGAERGVFGFEFLDSFILRNDVQRQLLDLGLHITHAHALLRDLRFRGHAGQVAVRFDVGFNFAQGSQLIAGLEHVIRPAGLHDDLLGLDRAVDGKFLCWLRRADANVSIVSERHHVAHCCRAARIL